MQITIQAVFGIAGQKITLLASTTRYRWGSDHYFDFYQPVQARLIVLVPMICRRSFPFEYLFAHNVELLE